MADVVRLLRRQRIPRLPRHRVQRDPRGGRAHRRQPALQIRAARPGRRAPGGPADRPRRDEAGAGPRLLHAVVRRARQGHRRRHDPPPRGRGRGAGDPLDGCGPADPVAPDERPRAGRGRPGRQRIRRGGCVAGTPEPSRPGRGDGHPVRRPGLLPAPPGDAGRHPDRRVADRLHRRPGLRAVDPGGSRRGGVGCAGRCRRAVSPATGGDARARRRAPRGGPDPDRGGLHERRPFAGTEPELLAVRDRARPARGPRRGRLRRPAGAHRRSSRTMSRTTVACFDSTWRSTWKPARRKVDRVPV